MARGTRPPEGSPPGGKGQLLPVCMVSRGLCVLAGQPGSLGGFGSRCCCPSELTCGSPQTRRLGQAKQRSWLVPVAVTQSTSLALERRKAKQAGHDFLLESALATASLPCLVARSLTAPGGIRSLTAASTSRAVSVARPLDCTSACTPWPGAPSGRPEHLRAQSRQPC